MSGGSSGREYRLGVLLGDGIGPEIIPVAVAAMNAAVTAAGVDPIEWRMLPFGHSAITSFGSAVPQKTLDALTEVDGWVAGPHDSVSYPEPHRSQLNPSGVLRKHFDLYANIRPAKAFEGARAIVPGTDLVIVRENSEGFYADRNTHSGTGEFMPTPDVAIAHGIITRTATRRIAVEALELAHRRKKHFTIVHKANVLRLTTGLFRDVCREVAEQYPDVEVDEFHIDAMTVHLLRRANDFDVIVTENMFGDILSDLTGEIAGSLGFAPSINSSATVAMAQASHGSAPDIAEKGIANPLGIVLSGAMLLSWLGRRDGDERMIDASERIDSAVTEVVLAGVTTADMGGSASTDEVGRAVAEAIRVTHKGKNSPDGVPPATIG